MAKTRTIDDIVNDIVTKKYKPLLSEAVKHVAKQAEKDIYDKAVRVLIKYYYGGYDPSSYDRTEALIHSIVPYSNIKLTGAGTDEFIECIVGVEYSPSALENYVGSVNKFAYDASSKYGQVDGEWIIENFLAGKHPRTNGSSDSASAVESFKFVNSQPMITQSQAMRLNEPGDTGYGLLYYQHTIFPKAVMNYIMVHGSK